MDDSQPPDARPKGEKFTAKMRKFAEVYAGNGVEAARIAGYQGSDEELGSRASKLLKHPRIAAIVRSREANELRPAVWTRIQRQEALTQIASDVAERTADRLRAIELLGRSEGDFTDNIRADVQAVQLPAGLSLDELRALARAPAEVAADDSDADE